LPLLFEFLDEARFVFRELFVSFVVDVIYGVYIELNVSQLVHQIGCAIIVQNHLMHF